VALAHPHEGNYFEIGKHATEKVRECMKGVSHVIDPEWGDGTFYEMCATIVGNDMALKHIGSQAKGGPIWNDDSHEIIHSFTRDGDIE